MPQQPIASVWNVADGKLVTSTTLPLGPFHSLAMNGKKLAVACGPQKPGSPLVNSYILTLPVK